MGEVELSPREPPTASKGDANGQVYPVHLVDVYEVPDPNFPPKIPQDLSLQQASAGSAKIKGNVNWDSIEEALGCTRVYQDTTGDYLQDPIRCKKSKPSMGQFNYRGQVVDAYETPSRTRSRTLFSFMHIPKVKNRPLFEFSKAISQRGPAWTHFSQAAKHKGYVAVIGWNRSTCPLCGVSRTAGNSIVHDFTMKEGFESNWVVFKCPASWPLKTTSKKK